MYHPGWDHTPQTHEARGSGWAVASVVAATDGANERDTEATAQRTSGLLAVHGIQS